MHMSEMLLPLPLRIGLLLLQEVCTHIAMAFLARTARLTSSAALIVAHNVPVS
jgi:hypothetical protein